MLSPAPTTPTIDDIHAAAARIAAVAVRTPLMESPHLNDAVGGRLLIKAEPLQRTGSFKFRGAYNTISQLPENIQKMALLRSRPATMRKALRRLHNCTTFPP